MDPKGSIPKRWGHDPQGQIPKLQVMTPMTKTRMVRSRPSNDRFPNFGVTTPKDRGPILLDDAKIEPGSRPPRNLFLNCGVTTPNDQSPHFGVMSPNNQGPNFGVMTPNDQGPNDWVRANSQSWGHDPQGQIPILRVMTPTTKAQTIGSGPMLKTGVTNHKDQSPHVGVMTPKDQGPHCWVRTPNDVKLGKKTTD